MGMARFRHSAELQQHAEWSKDQKSIARCRHVSSTLSVEVCHCCDGNSDVPLRTVQRMNHAFEAAQSRIFCRHIAACLLRTQVRSLTYIDSRIAIQPTITTSRQAHTRVLSSVCSKYAQDVLVDQQSPSQPKCGGYVVSQNRPKDLMTNLIVHGS